MQEITFSLSDEHIARLIDAFCGLHEYEQKPEETRAQFVRKKLREWLVSQVRRWEHLEAQKITAATITDIEITQ